jgi:hypothetical protein
MSNWFPETITKEDVALWVGALVATLAVAVLIVYVLGLGG